MRHQVPGRPAPIHSALIDWSHSPHSVGLTLPEARLNNPASKAAQVLESHTAFLLRQPDIISMCGLRSNPSDSGVWHPDARVRVCESRVMTQESGLSCRPSRRASSLGQEWFFPGRSSGHLSTKIVLRTIDRLAEEAGIQEVSRRQKLSRRKVTPHILRHSHVVNALMAGVPVPMIQIAGWGTRGCPRRRFTPLWRRRW